MKIQLKNSNDLVSGVAREPTAAQMVDGELAVNYSTSDPAIFIKNEAGDIIRIAGDNAVGNTTDDIEGYPDLGDGDGTTLDGRYVKVTGSTMTGALLLPTTAPTTDGTAANKKYVDDETAAINTAIAANYVSKSGSTMTGELVLPTGAPTTDATAANKKYVDDQDEAYANSAIANYVSKSGSTMTGELVLPTGAPTTDATAANKKYVDDEIAVVAATSVNKSGSTMTGELVVPIGAPTTDATAANKKYVDDTATVINTTIASDYVSKSGSTMTGALLLPSTAPTTDATAANKKYVDDTATVINTTIASDYVSKSGSTMTGALQLPSSAPTTDATAANKKYVDDTATAINTTIASDYVSKSGSTMTGALLINNGSSTNIELANSGTAKFTDSVRVTADSANTDSPVYYLGGQQSGVPKLGIFSQPTGSWGKGDFLFCLNNTNDTTTTVTESDAKMSISAVSGDVGIGGSPLLQPKISLNADGSANLEGPVGIGTSNAQAKLDVNSDSTDGVYAIIRGTKNELGDNSIRRLKFFNPQFRMAIQAQQGAGTASNSDLLINPGGGNVAIGTDVPVAKFTIEGSQNADPTAASDPVGDIYIQNIGGTEGQDNYGGSIGFSRINTARRGAMIAEVQTSTDADQGGLAFFTKGNSNISTDVVTEKVRIDHNGNVGIGGTLLSAPNIELTAAGTGVFQQNVFVLDNPVDGTNAGCGLSGQGRVLASRASGPTFQSWTTGNSNPTFEVNADGSATFAGSVVITSDLTVNGTTTTLNTQNLEIEDHNIELGVVSSPTDNTANLGGIILKGATDKTFRWKSVGEAWTSSEHLDLEVSKKYRIAGTKVLDATSLGTSVVSSSLTSVGTIAAGVWQGTEVGVSYGGTGQTTYANGELLIGNSSGSLTKATITTGTGLTTTNGNGSITIDLDNTVVKEDENQTFSKAQRGSITALTDAANIAINLNENNFYSVTLAGNRTLDNPTNVTPGQSGCIFITQDGSGSRTLAFGSNYDFAGGKVPTLSTGAGEVDVLSYVVRSSTSIICALANDFF